MKRQPNARHSAKRSLGQNFLTDPNYVRKIVKAASPDASDILIEIGPGLGALTEALVESGADVIAVELDRELARLLRDRYASRSNFRLIEHDALEVDFGSIAPKPAKLVANLPYNISTAILQRLADQRIRFELLVLMFQKEVVDRISAPPGNSERGFLTVIVESAFHVQKLFDVSPNAFRPAPKVQSSVVRLVPKAPLVTDERVFRDLLSAAFTQKRKTILNNLKPHYPNAADLLAGSGIDSWRRAESLSLNEWIKLNEALLAT